MTNYLTDKKADRWFGQKLSDDQIDAFNYYWIEANMNPIYVNFSSFVNKKSDRPKSMTYPRGQNAYTPIYVTSC